MDTESPRPSQPTNQPDREPTAVTTDGNAHEEPPKAPPRTGGIPEVVKPLRHTEPADQNLGNSKGPEKPMTPYELGTLLVTGAGVLAAVVVLILQAIQLGELKRATNAADVSARAAEQSAKAAVDAVHLQKLSNQQWLEGEWSIEEDKSGDEREVQVGLMIKNPTQMSLELKKLTVEPGSRASRAPGFSVTNMLDITGPGQIGPNGSFFATLIKLPWMTDDADRGAFITARVIFADAYGDESTTSFVTTALWVGGRVKLSGGHTRTVRNTNNKEQGQPCQ